MSKNAGLGWVWKPALLVPAMVAGATATVFVASQPPPAQNPAAATPPGIAAPASAASEKPASFDQALQIIAQARQAYQAVQDYTCIFAKHEVVGGQLQPENVMVMRVRSRPFSVHFKWQAPKAMEGQECCYVTGKNNGMVRARSPGVLGTIGFLSLDLKDPRVVGSSRYSITDAGIGNLIERLAKRWPEEKARNRSVVHIGDYEFARRRCTRVETINPNSQPGEFFCYRSVIYFDQETKLPVRAEAYDWPRDGNPGGGFLECYNYLNLKFNQGLTDRDFNY